MFLRTLFIIQVIGIIHASARPQQAQYSQDQNVAANNQAVTQPDVIGVTTVAPVVSQVIAIEPASAEASAAASAIAGHPVKVVKVTKKVMIPSATSAASSPATEPSSIGSVGVPIGNRAATLVTQPTTPNQLDSATPATDLVNTNTIATNDAIQNTIRAIQATPATVQIDTAPAAINTFAAPATTAVLNLNLGAPTAGGLGNTATAAGITSGLADGIEITAQNGGNISATAISLGANPIGMASTSGVGDVLANNAATIASPTLLSSFVPSPTIAPVSDIDINLPTKAPVAASSTILPTLDGDSRGSLMGDLLARNKEDEPKTKTTTTTTTTTTPKPNDDHKSDGLSGMFDDLKKKIFGVDNNERNAKKGEKDKKDDKDDKDKKDADAGASRGSEMKFNIGEFVAKNARKYFDQGVHLAINSAGNFFNKTAYKAALLTNAGIEQSALFATKLSNLEAELPARAFEKLAQLDCNSHRESLAGICPKQEPKKEDSKSANGDSRKGDTKKSDTKKDKKEDKSKKESSRNELPELSELTQSTKENDKDSEKKSRNGEKLERRDDFIDVDDKIKSLEAEKKAELDNLKEKLDSLNKKTWLVANESSKDYNSRASKSATAIAMPDHPNVVVSSSANLIDTTTKKPDHKESTASDSTTTTTTGKPSDGSKATEASKSGSGEGRSGLDINNPNVQTTETTTTAMRSPNLFESLTNIVKSIVPPVIPIFKTMETKTVSASAG